MDFKGKTQKSYLEGLVSETNQRGRIGSMKPIVRSFVNALGAFDESAEVVEKSGSEPGAKPEEKSANSNNCLVSSVPPVQRGQR